ncbi:protocatechuate 3,4-dioxygenase subunit alpha [Denitrobaculum tricleocarpae]|uniref:Protocatechuate 3,4-dioxygenase subunit alpha n=1 Tax=Denitrobaculum tricleocarpae TaxID=2591009 RepID=A0A545TYN1_9PROT|nr:protocatechuate 3,4-dioxygenase subunit alpha [Denitrobaculum tricleocarpae]TQV82283.1 protocatechuate 3,4-dioxygenase subunit alpha [Denitrobaculum tricleocarpae]
MTQKQTPSQTIGPFFAYGLTPEQYGYNLTSIAAPDVANKDQAGEHIRIEGQIFDGEGVTVGDAMIEIWQADAAGRYAHPADSRGSNADFTGFGRVGTGTDPERRFFFETIKPGAVGDGQAPHINVIVFMRGMLNHAYTRIYLSDEVEANAADPVLAGIPDHRRGTLIAKRDDSGAGPVYRFDIHMQGADETVFFDL